MVHLWHSWISRSGRIPWDRSSAPFLQNCNPYLVPNIPSVPIWQVFLNQRYSLLEASFCYNRYVRYIHSFLIRQLREVERVKYYPSSTCKKREMINNDPLIWSFLLQTPRSTHPSQHPQRKGSPRFWNWSQQMQPLLRILFKWWLTNPWNQRCSPRFSR